MTCRKKNPMSRKLISTRFTRAFDLTYPIALAPMDKVSGGRLAAAVSAAGGLGLIGGGYGEPNRIKDAFRQAQDTRVGIGIITWAAVHHPDLIDTILHHDPKALMVGFGDAERIVVQAQRSGIPVLWQVQTLAHARQAISAGVEVIVAQGAEAGGHGLSRGLMSLLSAIRDLAGPGQIILGAGGIADGRGLAAVLMLGGDGVLMGTRYMASTEADTPEIGKQLMLKEDGDNTRRSQVFDAARGLNWPQPYAGRVVRNAFIDRWLGREDILCNSASEVALYDEAADDDYTTRALIAGEALDLFRDLPTAAEITQRTSTEAVRLLDAHHHFLRKKML